MAIKKAVIKYKSLASRLGGASAFGFGVSWKPQETDRAIIKELITFLEDRRTLFSESIGLTRNHHVYDSTMNIRDKLTNALTRIGDDPDTVRALRTMRAGCQEFFETVEGSDAAYRRLDVFLLALGKLRGIIGQNVAVLALEYEIDVDKALSTILPPVVAEDKRLRGNRG